VGGSEFRAENVGENIYYAGYGREARAINADLSVIASDAVESWYDEIKDYDFETGKSTGGVIGHFTQVIISVAVNWKITNCKKLIVKMFILNSTGCLG